MSLQWSQLTVRGRRYGEFKSIEEKLQCQFIRREYDKLSRPGSRSRARSIPTSSSIPEFLVQPYETLIETVVGMGYNREMVRAVMFLILCDVLSLE